MAGYLYPSLPSPMMASQSLLQTRTIYFCSKPTEPTCGLYSNYVEQILVTVSWREHFAWRDQQSEQSLWSC